MKFLRPVAMLLTALASLPLHAADDDRARVTALADRYVAEYQKHFPLSYAFSGLPVTRHDGIDINAAADITTNNVVPLILQRRRPLLLAGIVDFAKALP